MLAACGAGVFALLYMRSLPFAYHIRFLGHCLWAKFVAEPAKSLFEETVLEFRSVGHDESHHALRAA